MTFANFGHPASANIHRNGNESTFRRYLATQKEKMHKRGLNMQPDSTHLAVITTLHHSKIATSLLPIIHNYCQHDSNIATSLLPTVHNYCQHDSNIATQLLPRIFLPTIHTPAANSFQVDIVPCWDWKWHKNLHLQKIEHINIPHKTQNRLAISKKEIEMCTKDKEQICNSLVHTTALAVDHFYNL